MGKRNEQRSKAGTAGKPKLLVKKRDKWKESSKKACFTTSVLLSLMAVSEQRNTKVTESERISIPNMKAHFEHLRLNSHLRFRFVHPVSEWVCPPLICITCYWLCLMEILNYILHYLIAINKDWKKKVKSLKKIVFI